MASESETEKRETLADIVAEIRAYGAQPPPRLMWLEIADRIEAAWKRENAEAEADALAVGGVVDAARHKRGNAAAWKETCAKCMDGEIEPRHCEYYGEPNGCNSPTYGEHPPVGNAAALRDEVVLRLSKDEYKGMQEALSEHDRLCGMLSESIADEIKAEEGGAE